MSTIELATTVTIAAALVLAPINPQPLRGLNTPDPEPQPALDEDLVARVRATLGLPHWRPNPTRGETETRIVMWSQLDLNDLYERVGGTVTSRYIDRTTSDGTTWETEEITLTIDTPEIGRVTAVADWSTAKEERHSRYTLPLTRALDAPQPEILETVPADGYHLGYTRYAITPGAPLPDGRTIALVRDLGGSAWQVIDDQGRVHWPDKRADLRRYTSGTVVLTEPECLHWFTD